METNQKPELLPCPFCGGEASQKTIDDHLRGQAKIYIECDKCNARTDWQYVRASYQIGNWWNMRTALEAK